MIYFKIIYLQSLRANKILSFCKASKDLAEQELLLGLDK